LPLAPTRIFRDLQPSSHIFRAIPGEATPANKEKDMDSSKILRIGTLCAAIVALASVASASTVVNTLHGTWTAYPGQQATYQTTVQQPINADGSSNFKANGKAVIPVKLALSQGTGAFIFESYYDSDPSTYPYSFLEFDPSTLPTLAEISQLSAVYNFTVGDCHAGSLRWTVYLQDTDPDAPTPVRNLDIHYQPGENGISDQFCQPGTSGTNRADMTSADPYVVINQFTYGGSPYTFTSAYNVTYAEAISQLGGLQVLGMNLIVDSGFAGNERVNLTSATVAVGGTNNYSETFTPQPPSALAPTCDLPANATIKITKTAGTPSGDVNEPISIQPNDSNGIFRVVDCKLMYNLATSSLSGVGTYHVYAVINGVSATNEAVFDLK
jgi:hypothetical protein